MITKPIAMRDALLEQIWQAMANDDKIFFVTADFGSPVLDKIRADYPRRFRNVGIAEQNLINVSAGLALEGFKVFAYAIAPFITMRCYEQLRVSVALLSEVRPVNINLIGVGAGYSYVVSGPTHQCYEDLTLMRALVNFGIYSPSDHVTAAALFKNCVERKGPKYLRLDAQVLPVLYETGLPDLENGYNVIQDGTDICLLATGYMVHTALKVASRLSEHGISASVVDLFDLQGVNESSLAHTLSEFNGVVSFEEGFKNRGGLDARMREILDGLKNNLPYRAIGVDPGYRFELGTREELHETVGIGEEASVDSVLKFYNSLPK